MTSLKANQRLCIVLLICFINIGIAYSQSLVTKSISLQEKEYTPKELIETLESQSNLSFNFNPADLTTNISIGKNQNYSVQGLLDKFVSANSLQYKISDDQIILFQRPKEIIKPSFTINGYIEDFDSKERLIGSHILDVNRGKGTVTNEHGFFSLTVKEGELNLLTSYIGYQELSLPVNHNKDTTITIGLKPVSFINEIEILGRKKTITERSEMSTSTLTQEQMNSNPTLLGENDLLRTLESLPGVTTSNNINSGLIVRGGGQDQNLVLMDGVGIYNIAHLLGIFSIFNSDVVKTSSLIKGAFPARYGGRLSSILDIRIYDGDLEQIHGTGSINLIASKLTLQGPLANGKTSFVLSGRRSYADLLIKPLISGSTINEDNQDRIIPEFNFFDSYFKLQHIINKKHRLFLSIYNGKDTYGFESLTPVVNSNNEISWGNTLGSVRWNWEINNKLFLNTSINYLKYEQTFDYEFSNDQTNSSQIQANYESGIKDYSLKFNFDYVPNPEHYIRFGISALQHDYKPGESSIVEQKNDTKLDTSINRQNINATELNAYFEDDFNFKKLNINAGLHVSTFKVKNTLYSSLQPRISMNYALSNKLAVKASYSKMSQFNFLVTSETSFFVSDLWVTSTTKIKPQNSWQVASGLAFSPNKDYELSIEAYYKYMKNVLSFKQGIENTLGSNNTDWESELTQGIGTGYGMEVFARKKEGRFNGWISYALSWNTRQFSTINEGEKYPYKYDSRHQFSIIGNYQFSKKVHASIQWNFATGNFTTIPTSRVPTSISISPNTSTIPVIINGTNVINQRNNYQFSDSHRLDFSISFTKQKKRHTRIWSFGLYNAYNNNNPLYIRTGFEGNDSMGNPIRRIEEVSLFLAIPSISYRFEF